MSAVHQAVFGRRWEYAGSSPPVAAVSRFFFGERGGGLVTPPGTGAIQHGFHCPIELVKWIFLTWVLKIIQLTLINYYYFVK